MGDSVFRVVDAFRRLRVLVVGDAMLDSYLEGTSGRLCPEAPVPVVTLSRRTDVPGGAANTAVNARSLGARVAVLTVTGADAEGEILRQALEASGVETEYLLTRPGRRTLAKHRVLAGGQLLVRYDQGDTGPVDAETEEELIGRLKRLFLVCDAVVLSDYGYGVLTPGMQAALAEMQRRAPRVVAADSKDLTAYRGVGLTAVKPNYREALRLLGLDEPEDLASRVAFMEAHGRRVLELTGARIAALTLDADGALLFERRRPAYRTYARAHKPARAAGAGDTFLSALALSLAAGADTPTAAELAAAAADVVVGKDGTASCSPAELRAHLDAPGKVAADREALAARLEEARRQRRRIVLTNGCFDILHRGHVTYLTQAKALGDVLVVGVNSDESIRRLKGPGRPINALEDRLQVLAALSCVDHVVAFGEDTPHELIRAVRPRVFVKGGDYTRERLPEASLVEELGGVIHILPYVESRSTTGLIDRIRTTTETGGRREVAATGGVGR